MVASLWSVNDESTRELMSRFYEGLKQGGANGMDTLESLRAERTIEARGRIENLEELVGVAREFQEREEGASLARFLQEVSLASAQDDLDHEGGLVTLMTLHNAKGLEFRGVFVTGLEEGVFPHARSIEEQGLEEERRLFYVGVTRARKRLFLSRAKARVVRGKPAPRVPSRFLLEIPEDLVEVLDVKDQGTLSTDEMAQNATNLLAMLDSLGK
mgnify:CR=1 FL=1